MLRQLQWLCSTECQNNMIMNINIRNIWAEALAPCFNISILGLQVSGSSSRNPEDKI
jgi:hypothetical protein